jgi:hypothetical protein
MATAVRTKEGAEAMSRNASMSVRGQASLVFYD